jgi:hypothetical protein
LSSAEKVVTKQEHSVEASSIRYWWKPEKRACNREIDILDMCYSGIKILYNVFPLIVSVENGDKNGDIMQYGI